MPWARRQLPAGVGNLRSEGESSGLYQFGLVNGEPVRRRQAQQERHQNVVECERRGGGVHASKDGRSQRMASAERSAFFAAREKGDVNPPISSGASQDGAVPVFEGCFIGAIKIRWEVR